MIVYQATKKKFLQDAFKRDIHEVVGAEYTARTGRRPGPSEFGAWKESLVFMAKALNDDSIPDDSGVAIEYGIPQSGKRVDFIVSGLGEDKSVNVVIVELKRWTEAKKTERDGIVRTYLGGGNVDTSHPSYQAWSYAALLTGFNEAVYSGNLGLRPCAYLHNYAPDNQITHAFYGPYIERAPLFLKGDIEREKLQSFLRKYIRVGDRGKAIYDIESGRIRPSKMLADSLLAMLKGKQEFVLIDEQKVAYESALAEAKRATADSKRVVMIEGGPGTGKSVVAINLLAALTKVGLNCRYVSKNAAPRAVYESKLAGTYRKSQITNFFSSSGVFLDAEPNAFDVLIVDEAHRLNEKSGFYGNLGDNQIKEIINAAKCVVFFIDDDQRVTLKDIGHKEEIQAWAKTCGASIEIEELSSQFRCNGSDGYLAWLDDILEIRPTANSTLDGGAFDFRIVDSPVDLRELIKAANVASNKARMVAGYCWNWVSKREPTKYDVVIPEFDFAMRWNLSSDGSLWMIAPTSVDEIGCIHTSQGLEVDYIGVIVGPDLVVRDGKIRTCPERRARTDKSLSGLKKALSGLRNAGKRNAEKELLDRVDRTIKNTYRTLMTRGMKGCYVYFTDPETATYFKSRISKKLNAGVASQAGEILPAERVLPFQRVPRKKAKPYINAVPLVDLKFAAGSFSDTQFVDQDHDSWAILSDKFRPRKGLFVAQVVGESMNRRFPSGTWGLFELNPVGTRNGRVVVAQHRSIEDPETGGSYTVKVYQSVKMNREDGSWRHQEIRLRPDSDDPSFKELVIGPDAASEVRIIAVMVAELG